MTSSDQWRLGWAFARSLASYQFGGPPRPFSATFAVTNRCNLRCRYCNTPFLDPHHLSLTEIEQLFSRLKKLGIARLGLAGGEPLVRDDLGEIVALAKAHGFWLSLNSNLNLYHRHEALFDHIGLVFTSLDGTFEHHRQGRGAKALDGLIDAIRSLRARRVPVVAICVVDAHNVDDADFLCAQAAELDMRIHFQPRCTDTEIVRGEYAEDMDNERLRAFWRRLRERRAGNARIASTALYLEHLEGWPDFRRAAVMATGTRCAAGIGFCTSIRRATPTRARIRRGKFRRSIYCARIGAGRVPASRPVPTAPSVPWSSSTRCSESHCEGRSAPPELCERRSLTMLFRFGIDKRVKASVSNVIANYLDLEHVVFHPGLLNLEVYSETDRAACFALESKLGPFRFRNVHYFEFRPPNQIFQAIKSPLGPMRVLATAQAASGDQAEPECVVHVDVELDLPWFAYPFRGLLQPILERADHKVMVEDNLLIERRQRLFGDFIEDYLQPEHKILFKDLFRHHYSRR